MFAPVAAEDGRASSWWVGRDLYLLRRNGQNAAGVTLWRWPAGARAKAVLDSDDDLTDCAPQGASLVCLLQTTTWPRRVVRVDLASGRISTVFDPNPDWSAVRLGQSRWVRFSDSAGRETNGVLTTPIGFRPGGRYPMVVIGYGTGDALRGDVSLRYPAQVLAARGFVTLVYYMWRDEELYHRPDYLVRMYSGDAPDGKVSYDQISALVDRLSAEGTVDASRVGIGVFSEGLNTAAWGLLHGDLFRAVATGWVRWNQGEYFNPRDGWYQMLEDADLIRDPSRPPGKIQQEMSLSLHAGQVRAPILANVSGLEMDHLKQWDPLRRFADAGRPLEMHVAPGEEHIVFEPAHRMIDWRRNVQWFEYWLQDRLEPDPVDPDQYKRWDRMRAQLVHVRGE
jgi:dipeptidyl aminopeptidase/acylaminoacyl peptidase